MGFPGTESSSPEKEGLKMNQLLTGNFPAVNGSINGRGIKNQKLSRQERIGLAADVVTGAKRLDLSLGQTCTLLDVTPAAVREELKARATADGLSPEARRLVEAWNGLSETNRAEAFQYIGVAEVWDVLASVVA
jgi:hypothetical protein